MTGESRAALERGVAQLGIPAGQGQLDRLSAYLDELLAWNLRMNLVGPTDEENAVARHLLDSLAVWPVLGPLLSPGAAIADVGSGAGLPGVPLAVLLPDYRFTLVERSVRKCEFLRAAVSVAQLGATDIIARDIREVDERFDVLLLRAVAHLDRKFLDVLRRRTSPGGRILLYKGRRSVIDEELSGLKAVAGRYTVHRIEVPGLSAERHIVEVRP